MTEVEWMDSTDPYPMLWFLKGRDSDRKMRLFVIACCRRIWHRLVDPRTRHAIEAAERHVEGEGSEEERRLAHQQAKAAMLESDNGASGDAAWALRGELIALAVADRISASLLTWLFNESALHRNPTGEATEKPNQAELLRDLFGTLLFHPTLIDPSWLTSTVANLAIGIYHDKAFERMPILADALQDAGCTNTEILNHCRNSYPHVRGCWVLDLILGKK